MQEKITSSLKVILKLKIVNNTPTLTMDKNLPLWDPLSSDKTV